MNFIINFRNYVCNIVKTLLPIISAIIVCFFNIKPLSFIRSVVKSNDKNVIAPSAEIAFTSAVIAILASLFIKAIKFKNHFNISIYDNFMENKLIVPVGTNQIQYQRKKYKLYLKSDFECGNSILKKIIEYGDELILKVGFPEWISYEIENKDDYKDNVIIEKSKNIFEFNVSEWCGKEQPRGKFTVNIELMSNSTETKLAGRVFAYYYLYTKEKVPKKSIIYFFRLIKFIIIFLCFDLKYVDKDIETS